MSQTKLNGRQARWCLFLTPYDFVIKHRAGKTNPADAPSRRPDYERQALQRDPAADVQKLLPALQDRLVGSVRLTDCTHKCDEMSSQGSPCAYDLIGDALIGVVQIAAVLFEAGRA